MGQALQQWTIKHYCLLKRFDWLIPPVPHSVQFLVWSAVTQTVGVSIMFKKGVIQDRTLCMKGELGKKQLCVYSFPTMSYSASSTGIWPDTICGGVLQSFGVHKLMTPSMCLRSSQHRLQGMARVTTGRGCYVASVSGCVCRKTCVSDLGAVSSVMWLVLGVHSVCSVWLVRMGHGVSVAGCVCRKTRWLLGS